MKKRRSQSDAAWKDILDTCFQPFVEFCLPELYQIIDWSKGFQGLDKELHSLTKDFQTGTRVVDKLFKVFLLDGQEKWILIHIEIQGNFDAKFLVRIFTYNTRLVDKYNCPVFTVAILTDTQKDWRPDYIETGILSTKLSLKFQIIKLIDYRGKEAELEKSNNIFASVILSQLAALEIKKQPQAERLNMKYNLTRRLYKKGFRKEQIKHLYYFLDRIIALPEPLEIKYRESIHQFEEKNKMPYISSIERFGLYKGRQQGLQEGRLEGLQQGLQKGEMIILLRQLHHKFGSIAPNLKIRIKTADRKTLLLWAKRILDAKTLEEVFAE